MDEINIKRTLRHYVTADVPPFPLTASALLAQGRRRQRWRAGLVSLGSGGMAGVIALVASGLLASSRPDPKLLEPPHLAVNGCGQPLPLAPWPDGGPSLEAPTEPSPEASSDVPVDSVESVGPVEPSRFPTEQPTDDPTYYPTDVPSVIASDQPLPAQRWPSVAPIGPLPNDPDPAKVDAMACYVKGAALILFPHARFAPASEPPMQVVRWPQLDFDTGWQPVYNVRAMIVNGQGAGMFLVQVQPLPQTTQAPALQDEEVRPLSNGKTAYINRVSSLIVRVTTQRSSIVVWCDANMITTDQAIALASAPELDIFS